MHGVTNRKPIAWRQLCAIAREQITAEPTIDDCEWAERIKTRLAVLGFEAVQPPHQLTAAMRAVQRALEKSWGPRPVDLPPRPPQRTTSLQPQADPPWPRRHQAPQGWTSVPQLLATLKARGGGSPASSEASMTVTRPLTLRQAERLKALKILMQGISEQMDRCAALEREVPQS